MADSNAILGREFYLEFEGRQLKIGPRDFDVERRLVNFAEQRDYQTLRRHAELLGGAMTREQVSAWRMACSSGAWEYGSEAFSQLYSSLFGVKKSFEILLSRWNPEFTPDLMDRLWEDKAKLKELDELADAANSDPQTPGLKTQPQTQS